MRVIDPLTITEANLTASSVAINDFTAWSGATAYDPGDKVRRGLSAYEAIIDSTNVDPATDDGTTWLRLGAVNRWKAFDQRITDPVQAAADITYTIAPDEIVDAVAFFGLAASSVQVIVRDSASVEVYSREVQLVDRTDETDWFSWHFNPIKFDTEALVLGFPGFVGNSVEIRVKGAGTREVGQIVLGREIRLGTTNNGTTPGLEDFSIKERDDFGNAILVERAFIETVEFQFTMPTQDARRVKRVVSRLRARPAVWFAADGTTQFGTTIYGFVRDFNTPLSTTITFAVLDIEGLT